MRINDFPIYHYVRSEDIEKVMGKRKYKKFTKWMAGQTGPIVSGKLEIYPWDLERYLNSIK